MTAVIKAMCLEAFLYLPVPTELSMAEWVYASNKTFFS